MIPVKHIDPEDLPLYAMQLLQTEETEELRLQLQHSVEARRVLAEIYGEISLYANAVELHEAPALARQRLMKHVARERKVVPTAESEPSVSEPRATPVLLTLPGRRNPVSRALPWLGWALAAGLATEVFLVHNHEVELQGTVARQTSQLGTTQTAAEVATQVMSTVNNPSAVHVMLTSTGVKPPPEATASYVADKGALVFLASNLAPIDPDRIYELWIIPADGGDPIPAGTFRPDARGNASVLLPQVPKGVTASKLAVTIENGDGSSKPTMPLILSGTAA
jgi:hypothetical protein